MPLQTGVTVREILGSSTQEGELRTEHVTSSVVNDDWPSKEFPKKVISQSKKQNILTKDPSELESQFYSKAKSKVDDPTYAGRLLSNIQEAEPSTNGAPSTTSQPGEKCQDFVLPTAASVELADDDWQSSSFRQKIISRIAEVKNSLGDLSVGMKEPHQMENEVYSMVKTKKDYLAYIARVLAYLKEVKCSGTAQQRSQASPSPQLNRTQDLTNAVQDTVQQVPKQHFSITESDDWRSLDFRQRIISFLVQEIKKSHDPKFLIKDPKDMGRQLYSQVKTRADYL